MVNLLFLDDRKILTTKGIVKTLYDPACGTGGMLSVAEEYLQELNPDARLEVFGQEINPESYAICKSDMLIKGQNPANIKFGNTFTVDGLEYEKFDYMLSNPPFGVEWRKAEKIIKGEYDKKGFAGRFGAGLPRINDGSFLFLQHMISKMKPSNGGSVSALSSTVRLSLQEGRAAERAKSGNGLSRMICSKQSWQCLTSSSTIPAYQPTSGLSRTGRVPDKRKDTAHQRYRTEG